MEVIPHLVAETRFFMIQSGLQTGYKWSYNPLNEMAEKTWVTGVINLLIGAI